MSDEWGPWIEHDGKGCPLATGTLAHLVLDDGDEWVGLIGVGMNATKFGNYPSYPSAATRDQSWTGNSDFVQIIRYRIRKPRGLTILENLIADLPAPVGPKVDA